VTDKEAGFLLLKEMGIVFEGVDPEFLNILIADVKYIDGLTEEQWEKGFKEMGGKRIETPHGTLVMIEPSLMEELK